MSDYKSQIARLIAKQAAVLDEAAIMEWLEYPPNPSMGDVSLPCFKLSKTLRKAPQQIAEQIQQNVEIPSFIDRVEAVAGYLNFFLDKTALAKELILEILSTGDAYGSNNVGEGKTIIIDYSSPNIAKPFHIGHLRSTMIGNAIYRIHRFLGYSCVGVNHLGDWGTQFGKLIVAYKTWGTEAEVERGGIDELLRLYVQFHEEAEARPELEDEARAWFVRLEQGDEEACRLWEWFKQISLQEFNAIYRLLGVSFDSYAGESFYNDQIQPVVEQLQSKQLLEEDDGAKLVRLDEYGMPPALILKKDGASLYHTRDIAAALYRKRTYHFERAIYVTGAAQNLHFQQWFKIIELMGYDWAQQLVHVPFGQVSLEGVKLSTRKGNVVMLEDLLTQAMAKTEAIINEKNPDLPNKAEVARQVGVGAIVFNDLSSNRIKDVVFSWEEVLNFDGETGPYVQYTHARTCTLLAKANLAPGEEKAKFEQSVSAPSLLDNVEAQNVLKQLQLFPEKITQAMLKLEPSLISRYLIDLAQSFNRFYHECPILVEDAELRTARLALVRCVQITLANGLRLIGLETPQRI